VRLVERRIKCASRTDGFTLYNLSDIHRGARAHDEKMLLRDVAIIRDDPNALWASPGDFIDGILPGDKRWRACETSKKNLLDPENYLRGETNDLCEILGPIADKCIGIVRGNHENTIAKRYYYSVCDALQDRIGLPYLGGKGFIRLVFTRGRASNVFTVHLAHGTGGGTSPTASLNMLSKQMLRFGSDITLMGHTHAKAVWTPEFMDVSRRESLKTIRNKRVGTVAGSYLLGFADGEDTYADDAGFQPTDQGMTRVHIRPWVQHDPSKILTCSL